MKTTWLAKPTEDALVYSTKQVDPLPQLEITARAFRSRGNEGM
jgi:hypothetical protein